MIDAIAIMTTHTVLLIVFWRLMKRDDLDDEVAPGTEPAKPLVPNGIGGWILGLLVVGGVGYAIYRSEKAAGP